jgi:hypothetical protein
MGRDLAPLGRAQLRVVMHDVEERFMNLSDVVKQSDAFDRAALSVVQSGRIADDESVRGDSPHVHPGLRIVGFDGVQQRFECRRGQAFDGSTCTPLTNDQSAGGDERDDQRSESALSFSDVMTAHSAFRTQEAGYWRRRQLRF